MTATREIAGMFDRIAETYDFLNHALSFNVDRRWRSLAIKNLKLEPGHLILDCGAGTGDMSLRALRECDHVTCVLLDPAQAMLAIADSKAGTTPPLQYILVKGVGENLPFGDASYDRFMVAFGIRNFTNLERGISELARILRNGGIGVILEFTPDRDRWMDRAFRWYMKHVMEPVGALISRDRMAYSYLTQTIEAFAGSQRLEEIFSEARLNCIQNLPLSGGIARLFVLEKH